MDVYSLANSIPVRWFIKRHAAVSDIPSLPKILAAPYGVMPSSP